MSPALPVPAGPIRAVTDEHTYAAFPYAIRSPADTALLTYRWGLGHVTGDGQLRLRRQKPGAAWWSDPLIVLAGGSGWSYGPGGMTCDPASGRVWCAAVQQRYVTATTADSYSGRVLWSDDDGDTWSDPVLLPSPVTGKTCPGSLLWTLADGGTLLAAVYYWNAAGAADARVRIYASTTLGATWTTRADLGISGRPAQEPQLVALADDRVALLMRSPGALIPGSNPARYFYDYVYVSTSTDDTAAVWSAPAQQIWHASGQPNAVRAGDGLAVVHRGQSEPASRPCTAYPTVVSLLGPAGTRYTTGVDLAHQQLDLVDGDKRRCLYGVVLPGAGTGAARLIWSAENSPQENAAATATVYERDIEWRTPSS